MNNRKNDIEVIINNRRYTLSGFESEEYLQKIATFLNNKIGEMKRQDSYKTLDNDMKSIMMQINLADEYFRIKRQLTESEEDSDSKSNEIYSLKHEIMDLKTKLEKAEADIDRLHADIVEEQKRNVRLETQLNSKNL